MSEARPAYLAIVDRLTESHEKWIQKQARRLIGEIEAFLAGLNYERSEDE
jgi:hypothetical protein